MQNPPIIHVKEFCTSNIATHTQLIGSIGSPSNIACTE